MAGRQFPLGYLSKCVSSHPTLSCPSQPHPSIDPVRPGPIYPVIANPYQSNVRVCPGPPIVPCLVCVCLDRQSPPNRLSMSSTFIVTSWSVKDHVCPSHIVSSGKKHIWKVAFTAEGPSLSFWFLSPLLGPAQIVSPPLWGVSFRYNTIIIDNVVFIYY